MKNLMTFDAVLPEEQIIKEYFCKVGPKNCLTIFLVKTYFHWFDKLLENCNLFFLCLSTELEY